KILHRPRWVTDGDQQALLTAALWPASGSLMAVSGLSYAFIGITEEQGRMAARESGEKGDLSMVRSEWGPLDQPELLKRRPAECLEEIDEIDRQLAKIEKPLETAREVYAKAEKPVKDMAKQIEAVEKEIETLTTKFATSPTADRAQLQKNLADKE